MQAEIHRSDVLIRQLTAGFAAAVRPISAQTITTDTEGLDAGDVRIATGDAEIPAYQARRKSANDLPVVLVVQEIFGVHEHIQDVCRRFAKQGYLAIAPELYARQGDVSKMTDIGEIVQKVVSKVPDAQVMSDLDAAVAWAAESGHGDAAKLGITGFCWGGRIVWLYSAHNPRVQAGAAWYGRLVGERSELQPQHPIDVAAKLKAPVLGLYGGKDQGIPLGTVEQMREALRQAGSASEIIVYPEAPHAFHADYRPSYRKADAEDGWQRLLAWFRKYGVA